MPIVIHEYHVLMYRPSIAATPTYFLKGPAHFRFEETRVLPILVFAPTGSHAPKFEPKF